MSIFRKFTLRSLQKNRVRSIVTVIGIMLSMAMFTAVIEAAYSGVRFLIRAEEKKTGSYHAYYSGLGADDVRTLENADGVKKTVTWQQVGWADIGSHNRYKPYMLIESIGEDITDLVAVDMIDGRLPRNGSEIAIPAHIKSNGGIEWGLGDVITVNVGTRVIDGEGTGAENLALVYSMSEDGEITVLESVTDTTEMSYTVVGIFERLPYNIEAYDCPGYTALTAGGGRGDYRAFFTVKQPMKLAELTESLDIGGACTNHRDLLMYYGVSTNRGVVRALYGMVIILVLMIFCGSVSLIYNSFSISVSERTRQFGMLKSIGATRKQLRGTVIYEALMLCAIGIPLGMLAGCAGIGITLWCLRDSFGFLLGSGENVSMYLVITPWGLLAAALICLFTALVSAWIPAGRAMRLSPIDALRQSEDIKLRRRDVRTSRLTQKLFGFEGMIASKNFARNRKRSRSTVMSLFLSVTLFISASSFCSYLTDTASGITGTSENSVDISYFCDPESRDPADIYKIMMSAPGVDDGVWFRYATFYLDIDKSDVSSFYIEHAGEFAAVDHGETMSIPVTTVFLDDDSFRKTCRENGISADGYFDAASPKAIIYDKLTAGVRDAAGSSKWFGTSVIKNGRLPLVCHAESRREIDGYEWDETVEGADGRKTYYYYTREYLSEVYGSGGTPDRSMALVLSEDEANIRASFTLGAEMSKRPLMNIGYGNLMLIYPVSLINDVIKDSGFPGYASLLSRASYAFSADDHAAAYDAMQKLLRADGLDSGMLVDEMAGVESERSMVTVINVFSYGFIVLISLIAMTNMFNTISTNILLRRREFAMLKSVGMTGGGFRRMMNLECARYGIQGLAWGLPAAVAVTFLIWRSISNAYEIGFYIPWYSVAIAAGSVFAVVFASMMYSMRMIKKDNPIDALKNENL